MAPLISFVSSLNQLPTLLSKKPLRSRICPQALTGTDYTTVLIVPTGIGANIGGYAGDALPSARLLASVSDVLITHPNVLNGALMYWPIPNALYVEGYALDRFCTSELGLQRMHNRSNKIGLLLDAGIPHDAQIRHLQAADAARATLGLDIPFHSVTDAPLDITYAFAPCELGSTASWGKLGNPDALLSAATRLRNLGCDAIAIVGQFPEEEDEEHLAQYRAGNAVDAIAGAEAVISHLVSSHLNIPCAHAPALAPLPVDESVSPKSAAEELGYTFLSCVLVGLSRAPRLVVSDEIGTLSSENIVRRKDVDAVVVPANAFGGAGLMSLAARDDILIIAVRNNETALNVPPSSVGIDEKRVTYANSYAEAAGLIAAHRAGISLSSLGTSVTPLSRLGAETQNAGKQKLQHDATACWKSDEKRH